MQDLKKCSFCGLSEFEVDKLIAGPNNIFICNNCVNKCMSALNFNIKYTKKELSNDESADEQQQKDELNVVSKDNKPFDFEMVSPQKLIDTLNAHVIGQNHAKKYYLSLFITITND